MSLSPRTLRPALIRWLYAVAAGHLLFGLLMAWAGSSGLFDGYLSSLEQAFWSGAVPPAARVQQVWWMALFGATLQSYALYMLALLHLGNRLRNPLAWAWLIAGLLLWAPQDMLISARVGMWSHLWIDSLALLMLLPPLFWLYRHDRREQREART